jgi:hypothetical protein
MLLFDFLNLFAIALSNFCLSFEDFEAKAVVGFD